MKQSTGGKMNLAVQQDYIYSAGGKISGLASGVMTHDGSSLNEQSGASSAASEADNAADANPTGGRDD